MAGTFMKKTLFPISHKFITCPGFDMENYKGEILECVNTFIPDTPYSRDTSSGTLVWDGGVKYGEDYNLSHGFSLDITFAFAGSIPRISRIVEITGDYSSYPSSADITDYRDTITNWDGHPSAWSHFNEYGPIELWQSNALAAMSRGGSHGLVIQSSPPNWRPPQDDLDGDVNHPQYRFLQYLNIFRWVKLGHVYDVVYKPKEIITYQNSKSISPGG